MKKKIIIPSIVVIIIIVIVIATRGKSNTEYVTAKADFGLVEQTVDATGSVESSQEIELNFKTTGRISAMNVKVGDKVKAGQTLAALEAGTLNAQVLEAQAELEKILAGSTLEDIHVSEVTVEQKKQDLASAQNDLDNLELQADIELNNLKNTAILKLNNELIVAVNSLETIDNTLNYKDAQATLGVLKGGSVDRAEESQQVAINSVDQTEISVADISELSTDVQVDLATNQVMQTLNDVRKCLSDVFDVLENTITSSELLQTELETLISDITTAQTNISTSKSNLQTAQSNWTNKKAYYIDQITKGEDNLKDAQNALDLAQAQLALKKAGPESYDVTAAKARLAQAQANLNDTLIHAPVSGTITEVDYKVGEQINLASPVIKMIGESKLEIEVDISEADIAKIEVGQNAEITLDAFGDDVIFDGTVTFIDPAETVIQDVVYYKVKVQFDDNKEAVKPGMTANVTIKPQVKNNVLRVPLRAVSETNGNKIVEVLVDNNVQDKTVTTGLKGDEYIEITSGLEAGDEVITFTKNNQ